MSRVGGTVRHVAAFGDWCVTVGAGWVIVRLRPPDVAWCSRLLPVGSVALLSAVDQWVLVAVTTGKDTAVTETNARSTDSTQDVLGGDVGGVPAQPDREVADGAARPEEVGDGASAYERIGGAAAVQAAVRIFYERVLADPDLAGYFETVEMAGQRRHLALMLTVLLGGPDTYTGRGLAEAHRGLGIPPAHYAKVGAHLLGTLAWLNVPADVVDGVRVTLGQVESQVVSGAGAPG